MKNSILATLFVCASVIAFAQTETNTTTTTGAKVASPAQTTTRSSVTSTTKMKSTTPTPAVRKKVTKVVSTDSTGHQSMTAPAQPSAAGARPAGKTPQKWTGGKAQGPTKHTSIKTSEKKVTTATTTTTDLK